MESVIKAEAKNLGFSLIGITSTDSPEHFTIFENWVRQERHGEMNYLEKDRSIYLRKNPIDLFEGCKSIVVLGLRYPVQRFNGLSQSGFGETSSFACMEDYHNKIAQMINHLCTNIHQITGIDFHHKTFVDTAPILERELAARAGLGWIGKNGCLISPMAGSFFLLGELFLTLELEHDKNQLADRCGNCHNCIDACPTQCILPNRTIDSNRCLSYLTIEHRSLISPDMWKYMDNKIFGCDICQLVCPWNSQNSQHKIIEENPPILLNLFDLIKMNDREFLFFFQNSPIIHAKRGGLIRNAIIVLTNQGLQKELNSHAHLLQNDSNSLILNTFDLAINL